MIVQRAVDRTGNKNDGLGLAVQELFKMNTLNSLAQNWQTWNINKFEYIVGPFTCCYKNRFSPFLKYGGQKSSGGFWSFIMNWAEDQVPNLKHLFEVWLAKRQWGCLKFCNELSRRLPNLKHPLTFCSRHTSKRLMLESDMNSYIRIDPFDVNIFCLQFVCL